ncbi:hypothetical protein EFB08_19290 [Rufibacter latericius]|uniref:Uncharacterized protein n=1 Tax=Rufibacter latericius TaxID=2487040 RepID=A0A3M9MDM3_9BACT|nr:hypothetical protein EFB08_19290 [Rufibacter latericius]
MVLLLLCLVACAPKVSTQLAKNYTPLDYREEVRVFGLQDPVPQNAEILGTVKIGDTGFSTNCGWDAVLEKTKIEARKAGGNALKIVEHLTPSLMTSSCHRITATILKVTNFDDVLVSSVEQDTLMADVDYALLHVYRTNGMGPLVNYDLFLGDSLLCRVKNNWKQTIKVRKDGLNTLWARTEKKVETPIKIEIGREYYVRCGVSMGAFVGHPQVDVVDKTSGRLEFQAIKEKEPKKK